MAREFSYNSLWGDRSWRELIEAFLITLILSFGMGILDVSLDWKQFTDYWFGALYIKKMDTMMNLTDPDNNCTLLGWFVNFTPENETVAYYKYQCFERDPIFAMITLACHFLPGVFSLTILWRFINYYGRERSRIRDCLWFIGVFVPLSLITLVTFPLQFILVFMISLINQGPEWSHLSTKVAVAEGLYDASLQYVLQIFIVFTREDREPSDVQMATMASSMAMLAIARIDGWLIDEGGDHMSLGERIVAYLSLLPLAITNSTFKLGSIGFITAVLRYNAFILYGGIQLIWIIIMLLVPCHLLPQATHHRMLGAHAHALGIAKISLDTAQIVKYNKIKQRRLTLSQRRENLKFQNWMWLMINTIVLISLTVYESFFPDTTPVTKYINYITPSILGCGIISMIFIYLQCWMDEAKEKEDTIKDDLQIDRETEQDEEKELRHVTGFFNVFIAFWAGLEDNVGD